eukprot:gene13092-15461_t
MATVGRFRPAPGFTSQCKVDCGAVETVYSIVVVINYNFRDSVFGAKVASDLQASASWNLCLSDEGRSEVGLQDECWYSRAQPFEYQSGGLAERFLVQEGNWYILVE